MNNRRSNSSSIYDKIILNRLFMTKIRLKQSFLFIEGIVPVKYNTIVASSSENIIYSLQSRVVLILYLIASSSKMSRSGHNFSTTLVNSHIYRRSSEFKLMLLVYFYRKLKLLYFIFFTRIVWNLDLFAEREVWNSLADSVNNICLLELFTENRGLPPLSANWSTPLIFALTMSEGFGSSKSSTRTALLQMTPFISS